MNLLNWHETGRGPDLVGAWLCDAGDHEAVCFGAAARDATTGEVLASLDDRFQTWGLAALWAEARVGDIGGGT